jgi:hypothetical protein
MKSLTIPLSIICLVVLTIPANSQDTVKKHSIGVQLNPYFDSFFFEGSFIKPVYAFRYGFNINQNLSLGPEVSGYFVHSNLNNQDLNISDINLGGFFRYSFLPASRIRPFLEFSPYYTFAHSVSKTIVTQEGTGMDVRKSHLSGYVSPGITLVSKNNRYSLDLMYKFTNKGFVNGYKSVFSYRFNYNF